jgi:hypothetical protein
MERGARRLVGRAVMARCSKRSLKPLRKGKIMKIGLVSAAALAMLALSTTAFAQAPTSAPKPAAAAKATPAPNTTAEYSELSVDGSQVVEFTGDPLKGDENSAYGFTMRSPPRVLRALLIRPRVNFVSELVKSVENL